jgi:hypothetical protein
VASEWYDHIVGLEASEDEARNKHLPAGKRKRRPEMRRVIYSPNIPEIRNVRSEEKLGGAICAVYYLL